MNKKQKIEYFVYPDPVNFHGIYNKINQITLTLISEGYDTSIVTASQNPCGIFKIANMLRSSTADIIILRNTYLIPILIPFFILQRIKGKTLIIDIPTPITNALKEFQFRENTSLLTKAFRISTISIFYPWVLLPFNKVLQYAPESKYFSFLAKKKIIRIANGIMVSSFPLKKAIIDKNTFQMIGVANTAKWHAFDRVLHGIATYIETTNNRRNIRFVIAGEGQAKKSLENLSHQLNIKQNVIFTGFIKGKDLDALFDQSNVAVSALGLFRTNLKEASALKSREYTARGIPFITTGIDIDFEPSPDFVYNVANDETEIDIAKIIQWYQNLALEENLSERIRKYASDKLDFKNKFSAFLPLDK